jgi:hypothetical protein
MDEESSLSEPLGYSSDLGQAIGAFVEAGVPQEYLPLAAQVSQAVRARVQGGFSQEYIGNQLYNIISTWAWNQLIGYVIYQLTGLRIDNVIMSLYTIAVVLNRSIRHVVRRSLPSADFKRLKGALGRSVSEVLRAVRYESSHLYVQMPKCFPIGSEYGPPPGLKADQSIVVCPRKPFKTISVGGGTASSSMVPVTPVDYFNPMEPEQETVPPGSDGGYIVPDDPMDPLTPIEVMGPKYDPTKEKHSGSIWYRLLGGDYIDDILELLGG